MGRPHLIPFYNNRKNVATTFVTLKVVINGSCKIIIINKLRSLFLKLNSGPID